MSRRNQQCTPTHSITRVTDHLDLILRIIRNTPPCLLILRIPIQYYARDLRFDLIAQTGYTPCHDGGALRVAGCRDDGLWAFGRGFLEDLLGCLDGGGRGAAREGVFR
jgi:hypothetical protein